MYPILYADGELRELFRRTRGEMEALDAEEFHLDAEEIVFLFDTSLPW